MRTGTASESKDSVVHVDPIPGALLSETTRGCIAFVRMVSRTAHRPESLAH